MLGTSRLVPEIDEISWWIYSSVIDGSNNDIILFYWSGGIVLLTLSYCCSIRELRGGCVILIICSPPSSVLGVKLLEINRQPSLVGAYCLLTEGTNNICSFSCEEATCRHLFFSRLNKARWLPFTKLRAISRLVVREAATLKYISDFEA